MDSSLNLLGFLESEDDDLSLHLHPIHHQSNKQYLLYTGPNVNDNDKSEEGERNQSIPQDQQHGSQSIFSPCCTENDNRPIVSPPFVMQTPLFTSPELLSKSTHSLNINNTNTTRSSTTAPETEDDTIPISDFLSTVKNEIMDIYQSLSENTDLDTSTISSKADEATLVHMMNTNKALMNTLRTTYTHAKRLQETTHRLQDENTHLKTKLNTLLAIQRSTTISSASLNIQNKNKKNIHHQDEQNHQNQTGASQYENQKSMNIDITNNNPYTINCHGYPERMIQSPGMMFATELAQVMTLDIGEYTYLANLMNRHWNSSS